MSRQFLENLANELTEILEAEVRDELNLLEHTTIISRKVLFDAVMTELNFKTKKGEDRFPGWVLLPENQKEVIVEVIENSIELAMQKIHKQALQAKAEAKNTSATVDVFPKNTFNMGVTPYIRVTALYPEDAGLTYEVWEGGRSATLNSFSGLRQIYAEPVKNIFNAISKEISLYREALKNKDPKLLTQEENKFAKAKNVLGTGRKRAKVALEHLEGTQVAEVKASRADARLQQLFDSPDLSPDTAAKLANKFGLDVFFEYESSIDLTTLRVKVGSFKDNASRSFQGTKIITERKDAVKRIREGLKGDLQNLEGSDSRTEIEKKKILKAWKDGLDKGLKNKIGDTNPELSTHTVKRQIKGKVKRSRTNSKFKSGSKKSYPKVAVKNQKSTTSLVSLIPLINAKLKEQVIKNMKFPALQNRTGRFAGSVRAVDVNVTKQGFPSIGYTYQKSPYQVFEQGAGQAPWASEDRDPRTLIDRSIREVARELLIGRFYTRRV